MPTIVYLHGLNSSPQSVKGQLLARGAAALAKPPRFHLPQLDHRPARAIDNLRGWLEREALEGPNLTLVGSSLGGFYATHLAERYGARGVLINPAIRPHEDLRSHMGPQKNCHTGEEYELTRDHLAELAALASPRITRPERYFLLVRTGDEVLAWRDASAVYAGAYQYVKGGGDHGWEDFNAEVKSVLRFAGCGAE